MSQLDDEIGALGTEVSEMKDTVASAVTVIDGITAKVEAAVQEALAAGATPEQLQAVTDVLASVTAQKQSLADAVASQGPAPAPTP